MSTDLLERTDTFEVVDVAHESVPKDPQTRHYVDKEKNFLRVMEGLPAIALCGYELPSIPDYKAVGPVCGDCQEIYEGLPE